MKAPDEFSIWSQNIVDRMRDLSFNEEALLKVVEMSLQMVKCSLFFIIHMPTGVMVHDE